MSKFERIVKLCDDEPTREKFTVMNKWDIICDDSRNPDFEGLEEFLERGKTYKLTIEEI